MHQGLKLLDRAAGRVDTGPAVGFGVVVGHVAAKPLVAAAHPGGAGNGLGAGAGPAVRAAHIRIRCPPDSHLKIGGLRGLRHTWQWRSSKTLVLSKKMGKSRSACGGGSSVLGAGVMAAACASTTARAPSPPTRLISWDLMACGVESTGHTTRQSFSFHVGAY